MSTDAKGPLVHDRQLNSVVCDVTHLPRPCEKWFSSDWDSARRILGVAICRFCPPVIAALSENLSLNSMRVGTQQGGNWATKEEEEESIHIWENVVHLLHLSITPPPTDLPLLTDRCLSSSSSHRPQSSLAVGNRGSSGSGVISRVPSNWRRLAVD